MSSPQVGNPRVGISASCPVTVKTLTEDFINSANSDKSLTPVLFSVALYTSDRIRSHSLHSDVHVFAVSKTNAYKVRYVPDKSQKQCQET